MVKCQPIVAAVQPTHLLELELEPDQTNYIVPEKAAESKENDDKWLEIEKIPDYSPPESFRIRKRAVTRTVWFD